MKIGLDELNRLIEDCKAVGFEVKMGDIIYALCVDDFKDKSIPYKTLFDKNATDKEIRAYNKHKYTKFLKKYIDTNLLHKEEAVSNNEETDVTQKYADMTFEENKDAMIKMIDELKVALDEGKIEYKDYAKMITDLRTKLNDKFSVSEKQDDQRVIVYKKYNDICICGREIYRPTRDDIIEDLKKTYDLVPKGNLEEEEDNERENTTED